MLLDQVFDRYDHVKFIFVRTDGKLRKIRRIVDHETTTQSADKPMFPIPKDLPEDDR